MEIIKGRPYADDKDSFEADHIHIKIGDVYYYIEEENTGMKIRKIDDSGDLSGAMSILPKFSNVIIVK